MNTIRNIRDIVTWKEEDFSEVKARIRLAIEETESSEAMKALLRDSTGNSGKMLRPLVMIMAAEDLTEKQHDELLWCAAAGEMLHTAYLMLDDVIDGAPIRRGKPSVQARYGKSVALCAGNTLMAASFSCLIKRGYVERAEDLMRVNRTVYDGEMLQDLNQWNVGFTEEDYMESIRRKTASVFAFSCEAASDIAERDEKTRKVMRDFGMTVGCMFQLRDDLLDWTSDAEDIGKPVCEDFANGTYTLPAICTFRHPIYGEEFTALAQKRSAVTQAELERAKELVALSGGIKKTKKVAGEYLSQANALLGRVTASAYMSALQTLADSLLMR